jgi:hypothetical protein
MLSASSKLSSASVKIDDEDRSVSVVFQGARIRESQQRFVWVYDGHVLSVLDKVARKFYRGPRNKPDALDSLVAIGVPVDPFSKAVLLHLVPFKSSFGTGDKVSIVGSMMDHGIPTTILRASGPRRLISMELRRDIWLPSLVTTELKDLQGRTISTTAKSFSFSRVNRPQAEANFSLSVPPGMSVLPLPGK